MGGAFCLLIILGSLLVGYVVIKLSYYIIHRVVLSEKNYGSNNKKSNIFWLLWMCCGLGLEGYIPKPIRPELSEAMWKGVSLVVIFIFCIFNFKKKPFKTGIDRSFTYIVASIFISIGMAYIYHDQTIDIGLEHLLFI